jgi:hypothetical protein
MKLTRKHVVRAVVGLVALVAVGLLVAVLVIDYVAKAAIEHAATKALGVDTTLKAISIGILRPSSNLSGLQVANPPGFEADYFLRLERGDLDMSLRNLLNDTVEIDRLTLSGITLNLVRESAGANFRKIIGNIREFQAQQKKEPTLGEKKFLIHEVVIENVHVNVDLLPIGGKLTELDVPIKELRLVDVGSDSLGGENLARIVSTVVYALLEAVIAKGESILPPEVVDELGETLSELKPLETLKAIRERLRERREQREAERLEAEEREGEPGEPAPDRPVGPIRQRLKGLLQRRGDP